MISLKRLIDGQSESLLKAALDAFGSAITAMATASLIVYPQTSTIFKGRLDQLRLQLTPSASPEAMIQIGRQVDFELDHWSRQVGDSHQQSAVEVKQILELVAEMAQSVADRDSRYGQQFLQIGDAMLQIAELEDLREIRNSLAKNSTALKSCLVQMESDGKLSVAKLRLEMADYQVRLQLAELEASTDGLTKLYNRRGIDGHLTHLVKQRQLFCVAILDLNRFKYVNDTYGHQTGDDVLRQFSGELRACASSGEVVARWGGDEFMLVLETPLSEARLRAGVILDKVQGSYNVDGGRGPVTIQVTSSAGIAEWDESETMTALIGRADAAMYENKAAKKRGNRS